QDFPRRRKSTSNKNRIFRSPPTPGFGPCGVWAFTSVPSCFVARAEGKMQKTINEQMEIETEHSWSRASLLRHNTRLWCKKHGMQSVTDFKPLADEAVLACGC